MWNCIGSWPRPWDSRVVRELRSRFPRFGPQIRPLLVGSTRMGLWLYSIEDVQENRLNILDMFTREPFDDMDGSKISKNDSFENQVALSFHPFGLVWKNLHIGDAKTPDEIGSCVLVGELKIPAVSTSYIYLQFSLQTSV